ncbi:lipopolysaccharide export system permease protein [Deinococcus metalli]|uniref:Permease n=1 Tax=Deinococcus metalli TaxID=1141878 RepID=A0A7W8KHW1_9DEIO|nr:LptF/LptG family permease [Deinococcus metalli]MBB5378392.1 lipopolysaccharide export system permease protein [Deinococcus metalli]GHF59259.1 permease [Deinococcus metalli]
MPLLTRSVLKEVLRWYGAGIALFMILQMTDALSSTVSNLISYHAPFGKAAFAFLSILPSFLNKALVMAVAFAILLAFSRMQQDSELKAISAGGIRPLNLVWPLALPFAVVGALAFFNADRLVPAGLDVWFNKAWYDIYDSPPPAPQQDKYTYAPPGALYYAGRVTTDSGSASVAQLQGVMVQRGDETITASSGTWDTAGRTWTLQDAWIVRPGQDPVHRSTPLVLPQGDTLEPPVQDSRQLVTSDLRRVLASGTLDDTQRRDYTFQLATRYADPLTALVFAAAAGVLGLLIRNRAAAFASVVVFIAAFYVLWTTVPSLARAGAMDPTLAAWLPNAVFLLLAGALAWRLR